MGRIYLRTYPYRSFRGVIAPDYPILFRRKLNKDVKPPAKSSKLDGSGVVAVTRSVGVK